MSTVIANSVLANGLRTEFADTYSAVMNRQADSRLGMVMDLSVGATNRQHEFAYFEAAPHMEYWARGSTVPTDAMGSVQFTVPVYEWARRVPWSKFDRKDDQTQSLFDMARQAGESAALLPERFFFDLLTATASTLPAIPTAPDGAALFATTAGGSARFGASNGNLIGGTAPTTSAIVLTDYYSAVEQFMAFEDGKGQPLLRADMVDAGMVVIFPVDKSKAFEEAFLQKRQGAYGSASGTPSNVVQDASRNVTLWPTSRLTGNDWYVCMANAPKKATFLLDREGVQEFSSLEGDNNGDHTRDTGEEYVQWERRAGAGIALPYSMVKISP